MPKVAIEERGCRGCSRCIDVCPTQVFAADPATGIARVARQEDCIGCASCAYVCPSRCLTVSDYVEQRPFHRIEANVALVERFLQRRSASQALADADYDVAIRDASVRLEAMAAAAAATLGRGQKAAGRKAGQLMAEHLPEMHEAATLEEALGSIQRRLAGAFDFEPQVELSGQVVNLRFSHCSLAPVVQTHGGAVGSAALCSLFHEYWGGLVGAFNKKRYLVEVQASGDRCLLRLEAKG